MQRADIVLSILSQKRKQKPDYIFDRLYRHLFNPDFYLKVGCPTFDINFIENMDDLKSEKFYPKWGCDFTIAVESILIIILEAVYGKELCPKESTSLDLRNRRFVHNFLKKLKTAYGKDRWMVVGEFATNDLFIKGRVYLKTLKRKIDDGRFIELLERYLRFNPNGRVFRTIENIILLQIDQNFWASNLCQDKNLNVKYYRYGKKFAIIHNIEVQKRLLEDFCENKYKDLFGDEMAILSVNAVDRNISLFGYEIAPQKSGGLEIILADKAFNKELAPFKKRNKPVHYPGRLNLRVGDIIDAFNKDLSHFYEYWCGASNFKRKWKMFVYFHRLSLAKTLAAKEKTSVRKVLKKYQIRYQGEQAKERCFRIGVRKKENGDQYIIYLGCFLQTNRFNLPKSISSTTYGSLRLE